MQPALSFKNRIQSSSLIPVQQFPQHSAHEWQSTYGSSAKLCGNGFSFFVDDVLKPPSIFVFSPSALPSSRFYVLITTIS
jgi:hypothetical protein